MFDAAEELARELGLSRSALYAQAVLEFVARHRAGDITARLDRVYDAENNRLAEAVGRAQARRVRKREW